ncbi:MAG: substrate-binding domain-containing protein [Acidobacteriota bacterium]
MFSVSRIVKLAICIIIVLVANSNGNAQQIDLCAGTAAAENIFKRIKEPFEKTTGLKLNLTGKNAEQMVAALDQGFVEAISAALPFDEWMDLAAEKGIHVQDRNAFKYRVIGRDRIIIITNKEVAVEKLSQEQLKAIFTGKITNWKEITGRDLKITVVWSQSMTGTNSFFLKQALDNENVTKNAKSITGFTPELRKEVAAIKGAIAMGPLGINDDTVLAPSIPVIGRPMIVVTKGAPSPNLLRLLDFLKGEGQKYILK